MSVFPFQLPAEYSFYAIVYILTLVLHAVFMTYVLAGSIYLAWAAVFAGDGQIPRAESGLAKILREWMPFALSAAITAGVAPLLFVQIIYRQQFYSSNLLLGWRWLVVVPVLIVAFYLLYVLKSKLISRWSLPMRIAVVTLVSGCFLFVAFCWTTNHLLGLDESRWPRVYETGTVVESFAPLLLRLGTWVAGAFPSMCVLAAAQLAYYIRKEGRFTDDHLAGIRSLSLMACVGTILAMALAGAYLATLSEGTRASLLGAAGAPWMLGATIGCVLQLNSWWKIRKSRNLSRVSLGLVSLGNLLMLTGTGFLRELVRFESVDQAGVFENVKAAREVGGLALFLVFTVMNVGLMAFCIRLVRDADQKDSVVEG